MLRIGLSLAKQMSLRSRYDRCTGSLIIGASFRHATVMQTCFSPAIHRFRFPLYFVCTMPMEPNVMLVVHALVSQLQPASMPYRS